MPLKQDKKRDPKNKDHDEYVNKFTSRESRDKVFNGLYKLTKKEYNDHVNERG